MNPRLLLEKVGIPFWEKTNRLAVSCPFHHDTDPSAGFYLDTELFHCFACNLTLSMVDFYARLKEVTRGTAARDLGIYEKVRKCDPVALAKLRHRMTERLGELRPKGLFVYARAAEEMEMVLYAYAHGKIDGVEVDRLEKKWYYWLGGIFDATEPEVAAGTPGIGADVRLQEGLAEISGTGRQDGEINLD